MTFLENGTSAANFLERSILRGILNVYQSKYLFRAQNMCAGLIEVSGGLHVPAGRMLPRPELIAKINYFGEITEQFQVKS